MIMQNIFEAMGDRTVIAAQSNDDDLGAFDLVLTFEGAKLVGTERHGAQGSPEQRVDLPAPADRSPEEVVK
jgi:hypothetical protein